MKLFLVWLLIINVIGCARNVEYVKIHSSERLKELGYTSPVYEGYQWSVFYGGDVWYTMKREDTPGVIYTGYLSKWGNELHFFGPHVVNTISGNVNFNGGK